MRKSYYLPPDDDGKDRLFTNISAKLPGYKATFSLTDADLAAVAADAEFFRYALNAQKQAAIYSQSWTNYKNAARGGDGLSLGPLPTAPNLGTAPAAVAPGIVKRFTALAAHLKTHRNYTTAIGLDLQIEGTETADADNSTAKPALTLTQTAGGVVIGWTKQGMSGVEIMVDRADGKGFVFLAYDTVPDYTDTAPLPPTGQSAVWKYKAIYHQGDERVGQWSDVVSIPVAG